MLEILVLTEDSRDHEHPVAAEVLKKLLLVRLGTETHVTLGPTSERPVREAVLGNSWRNLSHHGLVSLGRAIATQLAKGGVVAFHFDGDKKWSKRADAETPGQFDQIIRQRVRGVLVAKGRTLSEAEALLENLVAVVPYYSIESWTYQSTQTALGLCDKHHRGRGRALFEQYAQDRALLDEVEKPKDQTSFHDEHNVQLAKGWQAREVLDTVATGGSLAALVKSLIDAPRTRAHVRKDIADAAVSTSSTN